MSAPAVGKARLATGQQPATWPFPPMDPIQARNHQLAHEAARRLEQQRRQQRLRECLEALGEALL
jgi:hypothetical protein